MVEVLNDLAISGMLVSVKQSSGVLKGLLWFEGEMCEFQAASSCV